LSALPSQASNTVQVRVESLIRYYASLARVLSESGISGTQLNEIFSTRVAAECVQCGIKVSGEDMGLIAVAEEGTPLPHPKLERLRLGYCAREGCESYFYSIVFEDCPGVDWKNVAEKANNLVIAEKNAAREEEKRQTRRKRNRRMLRVALGLLAMVLLIVSWFVAQNGRLPFRKKLHKYQIDPASGRREPQR